MTLLDVLLVALVRGMGEVLPLGSSGTLTALPLLGSADGRAALTIATQTGILVALIVYFWRDVLAMGRGLGLAVQGKPDAGARLLLHIVVGTVPTALLGWWLAEPAGRIVGPSVAAGLILFGGVLLLAADRLGVTVRRIEHLGLASAAGLGLLQVLALLPGVSRTGITITAARLLGWERREAFRFSLLLAIPLVGGHGALTLAGLIDHSDLVLSSDLQLAAVTAGGVAFLSIVAMMSWVERRTFVPIALLRIALGAGALSLALWRGLA